MRSALAPWSNASWVFILLVTHIADSHCIPHLIVSLLFVGSQAEDKARGDWLCAQVRQYQKTHPLSNVIAFAAGDFRFNGPIDAADIVYEVNGCNQGVGGLGSAMIGGTVGDIANEFGPAVLPGAGRRIGDAVVNYMNPCKKFKMVAFADGSFTRRGDGGFENWCFSGNYEYATGSNNVIFNPIPRPTPVNRPTLPIASQGGRCGRGIAVCQRDECCTDGGWCAGPDMPGRICERF